jgi:hypothetical protein
VSRDRVFGAVVSIAMIAATVAPVTWNPYEDSFPLSTYPMFATPRSTAIDMHYVIGLSKGGDVRWHVPPPILGSSEVLQAKAIVDRAIAGGPTTIKALCDGVARRVAAERSDIAFVSIVRGKHDAVAYLVRGKKGSEIERHRCKVPPP